MIKYVLDTHAFLWGVTPKDKGWKKLGAEALRIIEKSKRPR